MKRDGGGRPMRRFIRKCGKWAVGERCQCGHARAEHDSPVFQAGDRAGRQDGLGGCPVRDCRCPKFRRTRWIFEGEGQGGG